MIKDTIGNNGENLKDPAYRVLIVGHSWGGDKAIEVANELGALLHDDAGLSSLYDGDEIQIHLVTLDAIARRSAGKADAEIDKYHGVHVASWLNLNQSTDTGFGILLWLHGGDFPDTTDDHTVAVDAALDGVGHPDLEGNGHHARMPRSAGVQDMVVNHLFPEMP